MVKAQHKLIDIFRHPDQRQAYQRRLRQCETAFALLLEIGDQLLLLLAGRILTPVQVLEEQINPAIASHGGYAKLVAVESSIAYLRLGGGCQGCGMAAVTLSQGVEAEILDAVPEISEVVDVTDHASGTNPYYEAAKK